MPHTLSLSLLLCALLAVGCDRAKEPESRRPAPTSEVDMKPEVAAPVAPVPDLEASPDVVEKPAAVDEIAESASSAAPAASRFTLSPPDLPAGAKRRIGSLALRHGAGVAKVALSPDGTLIASASLDGTVLLSDAKSGARIRVLKADDDFVYDLVFSKDGDFLFTASAGSAFDSGLVRKWSMTADEAPISVEGIGRARFLAPNPALDTFVVLFDSRPPVFKVIDAASLTVQREFPARSGNDLYELLVVGEGLVAVDGNAKALVGWDLSTGAQRFEVKSNDLDGAALLPGTNHIVTGNFSTLAFWEIGETASLVEKLPWEPGGIMSLAVSSDGKQLAVGMSSGVGIFDLESKSVLAAFEDVHIEPVDALAVQGDLLVSGSRDRTVKRWSVAGKAALDAASPSWTAHGIWVPDGSGLVVASHGRLGFVAGDAAERPLPAPARFVDVLAVSDAGDRLAVVDYEGRVSVRKLPSGEVEWTYPAADEDSVIAFDLAFSADGARLAMALRDGRVRVVQAATGEEIGSQQADEMIAQVAFASASGEAVVYRLMPESKLLFFWDLVSGEVKPLDFEPALRVSLQSFTVNAAGEVLVIDAFKDVWKMTLATQAIEELFGAEVPGFVDFLGFCNRGRQLAVSWRKQPFGGEFGFKVWDVGSGALLREGDGHIGKIAVVSVSANGEQVLTGSEDSTLLVW